MAVKSEIYVSVDIEASGPIPGDYSMLSIGACVVGRPRRHFYREFRPISARFVPDALKVSSLSMTSLANKGKDPASAMRDFDAWVQTSSAGGRPVMVAFNASFDWSFVNWYFVHFGVANPFGIGAVDIKSYYMGLSGASWAESRSSAIPDSYAGRGRHTHNALDDAREQASMFARMLASHGPKPVSAHPK
jgi:DNA polymerase III epsilon subunit-like protein